MFADGFGRELSSYRLARVSELIALVSGEARIDQEELILEDQEQNEIAVFYQIPVRMIFEGFDNGYGLRTLWRIIRNFV